MGSLTNISISNDFWHEIAAKPERLVNGIRRAMNYGTNSPLRDTFDAQSAPSKATVTHDFEVRRAVPQGVVVHKAEHYDTPQIIVNTYGTQALPAHEVAYAIQRGWLDLREYNRQHAEAVATLLEDEARRIRKALKAAS